jgi:uncharacterized membrane protein
VRVIILLSLVTVATALGGYALRRVDAIASWLLYGCSLVTGLVLVGAFFGWIDV